MKAAVIGAGIAGLQLARRLHTQGADVVVFEKARGPSGRLATRRTDDGHFDHGAQYFTARTPGFLAQVEDWRQRGVVERWDGKIVRLEKGRVEDEPNAPVRYVGTPRMSVIARDLAVGIRMELAVRISRVKRDAGSWMLQSEDGKSYQGFEIVLVAVPAPQAVPLLAATPALAQRANTIRMLPCHAMMIRFDAELPNSFDAAFVRSSAIGWVARNDSKPGREVGSHWIAHSTALWSESNLETSEEEIRSSLLAALAEAIGVSLPTARFCAVHRWLYARPDQALDGEALWDREAGIGVCGDWLRGDRVEDAYSSADHLFEVIRAH